MSSGWVKLYRSVSDHDVLANDNAAFLVFTKLLLRVDKKNGTYTTGRFKLSELVNLRPTTAWDVLKRLEKNKMVTLRSDNKKTVIYICNWDKYQGNGDSSPVIKPSSNRHQTVTKQEVRIKNKEIYKVKTQSVYDLFIEKFHKNPNTYKLTDKRKLKIQARLKDAGLEMLTKAITNTASSSFHTGDNDRGWHADLDFIVRSYEQVERLANMDKQDITNLKPSEVEGDMEYVI